MSIGLVQFAIVDVFTTNPLSGNPLAVVPDADALSDHLMGQLAREFNQSETTFIVRPTRPGADWRLRSFTPTGTEVFGAGHNALGAWWWLAASKRLPLASPVTIQHQELAGDILPLTVESTDGHPNAITMQQGIPTVGAVARDLNLLAHALGIPSDAFPMPTLPPQVVSTGAPHLMVPASSEAVANLRPRFEDLRALLLGVGAEGCYVFAATPGDRTAATARFFNPVAGIPEDPATGTAAGPLACYLRQHGLVTDGLVRIAQGAETGRPSELEIELRGDTVVLRGQAVITAEGGLRLNEGYLEHV